VAKKTRKKRRGKEWAESADVEVDDENGA